MLSLIIPTYNCMEYLEETLGSVSFWSADDVELILVDDGSDDGTAQKLESMREDAPDHVKILLCEHRGVSATRNAGLDAATGDLIAFMDCDDCLADGFFEKSRMVTGKAADLYIFSFERVEIRYTEEMKRSETVTPMALKDRYYETVSDFADHYIRDRRLLVYSACNKFYRKHLLDEHKIRFREDMEFGEDRLFNYDYLRICGSILTSREVMFRYMQRNPDSASKRLFPDYYNTIMKLHKAKTDCFTTLSKGTTPEEKADFIAYDLDTEMKRMKERMGE